MCGIILMNDSSGTQPERVMRVTPAIVILPNTIPVMEASGVRFARLTSPSGEAVKRQASATNLAPTRKQTQDQTAQ